MKGIEMTAAQVEAFNRKHGHGAVIDKNATTMPQLSVPKDRMNATERAFSLILEAQKRRGEIDECRFEGISLSWGINPDTGKPMWYTPDFYVLDFGETRLIEVKGPHIHEKDRIRFRGCRACWPQYQFELHQKTKLGWNRIE